MADIETLRTRLTEAEAAYHRLATGDAEAMVVHGSTTVSYKAANLGDLAAYIASLKAQLAAAGDTTQPRRRAIGVRF